MHSEHGQSEPVSEESKALGYEVSDVAVPVLLKWGVGLAVFFGITSVIVLGIYLLLVTYRPEQKPLFASQPGDIPPAQAMRNAGMPVVQAQPVPEIKDFRATEDARVAGYGTWVDGDGKTASYIPIQRAMEMIKQRGLPAVQSGGSTPVRANTNAVTPAPPAPGTPGMMDGGGLHNPAPPPVSENPAPPAGMTPEAAPNR